nr:hypothetical protein [Tanacetum cinerariifolium]
MGTNDSMKSVLTQSALYALCEKYYIPDAVHPQLPGRNDKIHNSPTPTEMDLFALIQHADPTKVRIEERKAREGEALLLELTRVVLFHSQGVVLLSKLEGLILRWMLGLRPLLLISQRNATAGKSLAALQDLLDKSTLAAKIGVTAAATIPFTKHPAERFVIFSDTPHDSSANVVDDEVSLVVRSIVPDPTVLTTAIATTVVANTSVPSLKGGDEPARASIFADSTSAGTIRLEVTRPSQPADTDPTTDSFYVSLDMDSETSHQTYVPKWDVLNESALDESNVIEFNVGSAHQTCLGAEVRMRLEHVLRGKKRLEDECVMQANLLKKKDAEIVDLKAWLSLREAEIAKAIRLRGRIANVEAAKAARAGELESLKERNLSCDDLSVKASTLECEKDKLVDQATCFDLRDELVGYKLLKEQVKVVQDEQVKPLSDLVTSIDSDLMDMALHMDEEIYPRYLTTIAGRKWILGRGLKLAIIKCLQSPRYLSSLGGALGRAIDKGMQDGLVAGVDHGRARRGLDDIAAYDPSAEANFDASMADIMDLLRLEGPAAETPKASQLQPSPEQLMVPIHRLEDQVITEETSLSFPLDVAHVHAQRIRGDTAARHLSLTNAMVSLLEPLYAKSLTGEASTSGFPAMTTFLSTTFVHASTVPSAPSAEVPPSPKIAFEQEELDTAPEHASAL